jgi:hypothetical protein
MAIFREDQRTALYVHLRAFESDFDKSQSQIRAISSAWSAAVLAAIALITTTAATPLMVASGGDLLPHGVIEIRSEALTYLRAIVCMVGSAGVLAFWYIDQGVYQRLLHSVFAYGLFAEFKDDELPQIRSSMFLNNLDVTNQLGTFYRAQFWMFALVSPLINAFSMWLGQSPPSGGIWAVSALHVLTVLYCEVRSYHSWPSLDATIGNFYPDLASALPPRRPPIGVYHRLMTALGRIFLHRDVGRPAAFNAASDPALAELLRRIRHEPSRRNSRR